MASVIDELVWSPGRTIPTGAKRVKCLLRVPWNKLPLLSTLVTASRVPSARSANISLTTINFYAK